MLKVGVLGAGSMGEAVIEHLKICPQAPAIVAYDINPERVAGVRQKYGIHGTTALGEVLSDPDIPLVFVVAANTAHKELALGAMRAGKAVLCEKPIATTLDDARAIVEEAERHKGWLQIGFELRYSRLYSKVKDWIDAGLLGQVVDTNCHYICSEFIHKGSWRLRRDTCGSMFGEKLCHYVDLPRWWVGSPVTEVYSLCGPNVIPYYEIRDNYQTSYRFASGAVSHLTFHMAVGQTYEDQSDPLVDWVDRTKDDGHALQYLVVGTRGAASTDIYNRRLKRWEFGDSPVSMTSRIVEDLTWPRAEDHVYFHNTLDQTHDIVRRVVEGLPPRTPARDAYETMRLVEAAERSADSGRVIQLSECP